MKFKTIVDILIFCSLLNTGAIFAQPVFEIKWKEKSVGKIAGGFHSPNIPFQADIYARINRHLESVDIVYIESTGTQPTVPQVVQKFGQHLKSRMRELIAIKKSPCLEELAKDLNSSGINKSHLLDLEPFAFFMRGVLPATTPSRRISINALSIDDYYQYQAVLKGLQIVELEGWENAADFLKRIDESSLFNSAELACVKVRQSDFLKNSLNLTNFDLILDNFETGNVDELRKIGNNGFLAVGWPEKAVFAITSERDHRFALKIDQTLQEKKHLSPLFLLGAAHLGGEDGVLSRLKKLGYTIMPAQN